jgi:hypothetical protein
LYCAKTVENAVFRRASSMLSAALRATAVSWLCRLRAPVVTTVLAVAHNAITITEIATRSSTSVNPDRPAAAWREREWGLRLLFVFTGDSPAA